MKYVQKRVSPERFESWIEQEKPKDWNQLPGNNPPLARQEPDVVYFSKEELREHLLQEQYFLCCYCNARVENNVNEAIIDHVSPKEGVNNQHLIFDYDNLSVSCTGGQKDVLPRTLHCDAHKKRDLLPISHLTEKCEKEITFDIEGNISGATIEATETIQILNLNIPKLNIARQQAISGYIYQDLEETQLIAIEDAQQLIDSLLQEDDGRLIAYHLAVIQALQAIVL